MKKRIVLDTNCLISSLSRTSDSYEVWRGLYEGRYILCVSNEILTEYQEIIGQKITPEIAENVIQFLINSEYVEFVNTIIALNLSQPTVMTISLSIVLLLPMLHI